MGIENRELNIDGFCLVFPLPDSILNLPLACLPRFVDKLCNSIQFLGRYSSAFGTQERRDDLLGRSFKKGVDHVPERGLPYFVTRNNGRVNVSQADFLMLDVAFVFQYPELRAHR